jgi:hypothetical protein
MPGTSDYFIRPKKERISNDRKAKVEKQRGPNYLKSSCKKKGYQMTEKPKLKSRGNLTT